MKIRLPDGTISGDTGTKLNGDSQSRKWLLTINNPQIPHDVTDKNKAVIASLTFTHDDIKDIIIHMDAKPIYWAMCDEVGDSGTYHTHLFLCYENGVRFSTLKSWFYTADIENCKGSARQNRDYLLKQGTDSNDKKAHTKVAGTFEEFGEVPIEQQGKRSDLENIYDLVKQGASNIEIMEMYPNAMLYIDKIEQVRQLFKMTEFSKQVRKVEGLYIYGAPGTGKSSYVWNLYGTDLYRVSDYQHPFDRYAGQPILWLEEFDSVMMPYYQLKMLFDGFPDSLPARYNNKTACYTKIIVTTNRPLEKQYIQLQQESIYDFQAILRRFQAVYTFKLTSDHPSPADPYIIKQSMREYLLSSNTFKKLPADFQTPFDVPENLSELADGLPLD